MMDDEQIREISLETRKRLSKFNHLRGNTHESGEFWDFVVLTAIDEEQKCAYELQLQQKMERKELPLSTDYVVIADPPGPKIGNGGSTFVVMDRLANRFGVEIFEKKIIIVHAGGFSQRLPSASILGKVFLGIPVGEPMYQALELKLATYVDFPSKISSGGIFVCSADSVEVYTDKNFDWTFPSEGFTALAHMSPVSIGEKHGVFVLDRPVEGSDIMWDCKKFLHKPSLDEMLTTNYCIVHEDNVKWVMTDSAFLISNNTAKKMLEFYHTINPLTCEVDAYGDFLQALGRESNSNYTRNAQNVCQETDSFVETRLKIYDFLKGTPLHAIVLSKPPCFFTTTNEISSGNPASKYYHIGTMPEYLFNFCEDKGLRATVGVQVLTSCSGIPFIFNGVRNEPDLNESLVKINRKGALSCSIARSRCFSPCIIGSVIQSNVSIGEKTIVEYCLVGEGVCIGANCVVSNSHIPASVRIPNGLFMHTVAVSVQGGVMYVTITFDVASDLKKSMPTEKGLDCLTYFGKTLRAMVPTHCDDSLSLWNAKLFPAAKTMEQSCQLACKNLQKIGRGLCSKFGNDEGRFSMQDVIQLKDLRSVLEFRMRVAELVQVAKLKSALDHPR